MLNLLTIWCFVPQKFTLALYQTPIHLYFYAYLPLGDRLLAEPWAGAWSSSLAPGCFTKEHLYPAQGFCWQVRVWYAARIALFLQFKPHPLSNPAWDQSWVGHWGHPAHWVLVGKVMLGVPHGLMLGHPSEPDENLACVVCKCCDHCWVICRNKDYSTHGQECSRPLLRHDTVQRARSLVTRWSLITSTIWLPSAINVISWKCTEPKSWTHAIFSHIRICDCSVPILWSVTLCICGYRSLSDMRGEYASVSRRLQAACMNLEAAINEQNASTGLEVSAIEKQLRDKLREVMQHQAHFNVEKMELNSRSVWQRVSHYVLSRTWDIGEVFGRYHCLLIHANQIKPMSDGLKGFVYVYTTKKKKKLDHAFCPYNFKLYMWRKWNITVVLTVNKPINHDNYIK